MDTLVKLDLTPHHRDLMMVLFVQLLLIRVLGFDFDSFTFTIYVLKAVMLLSEHDDSKNKKSRLFCMFYRYLCGENRTSDRSKEKKSSFSFH